MVYEFCRISRETDQWTWLYDHDLTWYGTVRSQSKSKQALKIVGFGTKSVKWIENLTIIIESVLFAHTLLLHWSNIYYQKSFYLHLISSLIENGIRISNLMMFCIDLIKFLKDRNTLWNGEFCDFSCFSAIFRLWRYLKNRLLNAISAQLQINSGELVLYKGRS